MKDEIIVKLLKSRLIEDTMLGFEYCLERYGITKVLEERFEIDNIKIRRYGTQIHIEEKISSASYHFTKFIMSRDIIIKLLNSTSQDDVRLGYEYCKIMFESIRIANRHLREHKICIVKEMYTIVHRDVDWDNFSKSNKMIL